MILKILLNIFMKLIHLNATCKLIYYILGFKSNILIFVSQIFDIIGCTLLILIIVYALYNEYIQL